MRIDEHFKVARDFDAARGKLDPEADGLAVIEMLMMAGTNYMNAVLHANRITPETLDLTHTDKPKPADWNEDALPVPVRDLMSALSYIETARKRNARGIVAEGRDPGLPDWSEGTVRECLARYGQIKEVVQCVFARAAG